jgi:hypothetical protein
MKPNVFVHVRITALDVINSEVRTYIYMLPAVCYELMMSE